MKYSILNILLGIRAIVLLYTRHTTNKRAQFINSLSTIILLRRNGSLYNA